ncbi:MAG: hypothetical protein HDR02_08410 [Lachnospiraceae bacterium]|nr:hypothetical protein [Lachnospiraceae bacterium]
MDKLTTLKRPEIIMVSIPQLTAMDKYRLLHIYETRPSQFIISCRKSDVIILNRDMEKIEEILQLVQDIMDRRYLNSLTEKMLNRFRDLTSDEANMIILSIWSAWRAARQQAEMKEQAEWMIREFKRNRLTSKARKSKEMLKMLDYIGTGIYEGNGKYDPDTGRAYCYMYGFMQGAGLL